MAEPTELPIFDENDTNTDVIPDTLKDDGFGLKQKAPSTIFNTWFRNVYKWIEWFKAKFLLIDADIERLQPVESIADLRAIDITNYSNGATITATGYYAKGDGGGGPVRYLDTGQIPAFYTDNGGSIIVPDGGDGSEAWLFNVNLINTNWYNGGSNTIVDDAISKTGKNGLVYVSKPTYDEDVSWLGRRHMSEAPHLINSFTWSGASTNARMSVDKGCLYVSEFSASKVGVWDISDKRDPVLIHRFSTGTNPRDVVAIGRYLYVTCNGAAKVEVYDVSIPDSATLVGTIACGANPKMSLVLGDIILIVCYGADTVEKHRFMLPTSGSSGFTSEKLDEVSVSSGPLSIAYNGNGVAAVCGLDTANIDIIGTDGMVLVSTTPIGGVLHAECLFANKFQLLVTDSTNDRLYSLDCSSLTPVVSSYVDTSIKPQQMEIIGHRCYTPSFTGAGIPGALDCFDITDVKNPVLFDTVTLTGSGTAFTAYAGDDESGYIYVNSHESPLNIDIVEIPVGNDRRIDAITPEYANIKNFAARNGVINAATINAATINDLLSNVLRFGYRTETTNTTSTNTDLMIRVGSSAAVALHDPSLAPDGQVLIINNVSATTTSNITNAFTGYSGSLLPDESVALIAVLFSGTYQWDKFLQM